jgi:hypothetical protein
MPFAEEIEEEKAAEEGNLWKPFGQRRESETICRVNHAR